MTAGPGAETLATYQNPVYGSSFPDPYVLRHGGCYYAYSTGLYGAGIFGVLSSIDLIKWTEVGHAMPLPAKPEIHYWAPEVSYAAGTFYLYYSAGDETLMQIRLATSDRPDGGFTDAGVRLTLQDFAIDPHVFTDRDGKRYLFYATDFLDHTHIGTGTVVDEMLDWTTLAGKPRPVTRARFDWQIYDPNRQEKGGVRWHTVEGPAVIERKGLYFEMFSGGNWQDQSYGMSFAVTTDLASEKEWEQNADGDSVMPVIRTTPEVVGPGHNSIVKGPNGRELYCVYHRWTDAGRVMAIDRMDIVDRRLYVVGPTNDAEPAPHRPRFESLESGEIPLPASCLIGIGPASTPNAGLAITGPSGEEIILLTLAAGREYQIELDGMWCGITADGWERVQRGYLAATPSELRVEGDVDSFILTEGFEELFDRGSLRQSSWQVIQGTVCEERENELLIGGEGLTGIGRDTTFEEVELLVNARCESPGTFGLALYDAAGDEALSVLISQAGLELTAIHETAFSLPKGWDICEYHAYRIMTRSGRALVWLEQHFIGAVGVREGPYRVAVLAQGGSIALDTVRATAI
jgi:GH43 family beta-xylosidase